MNHLQADRPRSEFRAANEVRRGLGDFFDLWRAAGPACAMEFACNAALEARSVLREHSLAAIDRRMSQRPRRFRCGANTVNIAEAQFAFARENLARRAYFPEPPFSIQPGDAVVDLGANGGVFALAAAACGARVLAVEAVASLADAARANCAANRCGDRVSIENVIVGGESGMFANSEILRYDGFEGPRPHAIGMSELLERHGIRRIDFLKVDIEGSEYPLLAGSPAWLRNVGKIAMEAHYDWGGDPQALAGLLRAEGFRVHLRDKHGTVVDRIPGRRGYIFAAREVPGSQT